MSEKDKSGRISFQDEAGANVILYLHFAYYVGAIVVKDGKARVEFVGMSSSSLCNEPGLMGLMLQQAFQFRFVIFSA